MAGYINVLHICLHKEIRALEPTANDSGSVFHNSGYFCDICLVLHI